MIWVNIIALIILCFSLLGGIKEGAVKNLFSLAIQIFAIFIAGHIYHLIATVLSFLELAGRISSGSLSPWA